jgi:hypothetical protein
MSTDPLSCVNCERDADANRAVVDAETGAEFGGLCYDCERETFGICLEEALWAASKRCLFCPRQGSVALPTHKMEISLVDGEEGVEENYGLTDETARLCPTHANQLFELGGDETERSRSVRRRPPSV